MGWREWLGLELTPERFARKIGKSMQATKPGLKLVLDLENFRLRISESDYFNLHNAYHAFKNAPRKEREKVMAQFVEGMLNPPVAPLTFEEVRSFLLPVLRRKSLLDYVMRETPLDKRGEGGLAYRDFGPDVVLALAFDAEQSLSIVMEAQLKEWGVTFETALEAAMDNLRNRSIDNFCAIEGAPGLTRSNWLDAYDSSRILLPDLLFRGVASGDPVVMIPTRETLLLAPDNNAAAQLAMLALAGQALQDSSRWCSTAMYKVVDGRLDVYEPQDAQVRESLRAMERDVAMSDYADQQQQLEKAHERDGQDIFVASFSTMKKDGRIVSFCTWNEEVTAGMLPKTDFVALGRPRTDGGFDFVLVDWQTLLERHANLLQEMSVFPPRYQVAAFPAALFDEMIAAKQRETA
ncbi:hypothetical protein [Massilia horti]|uniref:DUF1444 family protein n=1 Tax=Massilia horti TaxID=2562153 RepID=A0A4Y9SZY4_9BURK|nr:hypothetical protein [Massilia horti]TFW32024.1 hypothetical protein E4O92_11370 [Massilia horti]